VVEGPVIDEGVPLPPKRHGQKGGKLIYPFDELKPGDSFERPADQRNTVKAAATQYGKRHGKTFATRITGDTIRVWRTA
jgi:hypothetical protein